MMIKMPNIKEVSIQCIGCGGKLKPIQNISHETPVKSESFDCSTIGIFSGGLDSATFLIGICDDCKTLALNERRLQTLEEN